MSSLEIKLNTTFRKRDFSKIYDKHFNALCAFAYRYFPDSSTVEDLVQETFIGFWEKRNDFDDLLAIKSYLYTSVKNKCLNLLKHQSVIQKHEKQLIYELESDHYFKNHVIEEETFNKLFLEIQNLPEAAKKVMLLALNGVKNPEIAEELDISVNTVKTQKKIAYARLKKELKPSAYSILISL